MRSYPVSKFKAHALGILAAVAETGEGVVVTKHGKPLVKVEPWSEPSTRREPGGLTGTLDFTGDTHATSTGGTEAKTR